MKETFNTIVAIMTLANGKKYVTTCEYGTDAYDNLKDTIYKSASRELKQAMNEGCDIEAYSVCPAKNAEELKNMLIYRYATDREQFGYNNISMSSATNGHPKGETHYKAKSVTLKDTLNNKTVTYPTIQALADAIGRKYSTVHKYLKESTLLDGRYLISYSEPVECPINEEEAIPDTFIEKTEEEPLNDEFRALEASGNKYAGKSFVLWDLYSGEKAKRYQSMEELLEDNPEITEPQAYEMIENKLKLRGRIRIMLEEEYEDMISTI